MDDTEGSGAKSWGAAVEGLKSESREQRRTTLKSLDDQLKATPEDQLAEAFNVLHPALVACVADETEKCRELTISLLGSLLQRLPVSDYYLTYVVPAIRKRITSTSSESSEEIRLALVQLLHSIIKHYGKSTSLVPFFDDFVEILVKTSSDDCPTVKQETCFVVMSLANYSPKDFHMRSETLCMSILSIFQQRPFKVRVAAIQCIGIIVLKGTVTCFDHSILPMVLKLFDECNLVRLQVVKEIGNWMLNYPERYSYWHYMIPIMLTSMCDYTPEIQAEATTAWDNVGLQYIKENEEELKDKIDFPSGPPKHYPSVPRPNLGCRTLIIRNMGKIIPAISKEMSNWQEGARLRSAQALGWLILSAEEKNMMYGSDIMNCLIQGAKDSDPAVTTEILKAAEMYGHFVEPKVWWILIGLDLDIWEYLSVLPSIINGTHIDQLKNGYLRKIMKTLSQSQFTNIQKPKYQISMLNVCEAMMNVGGLYCQSVSQEMFNIIFIIYSIPNNPDIEHYALCLIEKLRETIKFGSNIEELYCHYVRQLLVNITSDVNFWTLTTPDRCVLNTILVHTGPAIGLHLHLISPLLSEVLSTKGIDPTLKLELFTTLCSVLLRRDEHFKLSEPDKLDAFLSVILKDIIIPNLGWRVGQTAEALRTAAVCCLCAILQDNESVSKVDGDVEFDKCIQKVELFPDTESFKNDLDLLLPTLVSLINDRSKNTCLYSLRAIRCLVILAKKKDCFSIDHLHTTYSPIISRLDDSNDKVRLFAVETLCTLFMARPETYDADAHNMHIEALYNAMLLHLDDPDPNFQDFVLDALKKLCDVDPKMMKGKVVANSKVFRNTKALENLGKHLEMLSI